MPYLVVRTQWPAHKRAEVLKKTIEIRKKYPPSNYDALAEERVRSPSVTLEGAETLGIWEVKKGKLEEFLDLMGSALLLYADIEGFHYSMEVRPTLLEAFARAGLPPLE